MSRLGRLVTAVGTVGLLVQLGTWQLVAGRGAVAPLDPRTLPWAHDGALAGLLLVLTFAGDWVNVRVRHGEETEELTLFEAACVVDVLLLPATTALVLPVLATILCSSARRRGLVKTCFNGGNLAAAVAVLVLCVHLGARAGDLLSLRTVVALTVGVVGLTLVNLLAMSRVLAVVAGDEPWQVVRSGLRLSGVMAVGTVALGGTAVILARDAPALLPFSVMPAAALMFAFRAAAQESEERERSAMLLALSQLLAGRLGPEQLLEEFLALVRQAFGADVAVAVLDEPEPAAVVDDRTAGRARRTPSCSERAVVGRMGRGAVLTDGLPDGWHTAVVAPLEAEGRRFGAVLLAVSSRNRRLGRHELTLLTPLASALAAAVRSGAHLALLVQETSKLQAVVAHCSDGILVLDGGGAVQLWSPAVAALVGIAEPQALGEPWGSLVVTTTEDGDLCDAFEAGRTLLTPSCPQATVELVLLRPDGDQRVVRCAHAGVYDDRGALTRDVVIVHDVTRERQVERLKADFIATVSHELRTPITPIKGYADLLRRRGHLMTEPKRAECLEIISDRAAHLSLLVEDLLLASRISATGGSPTTKVALAREDLAALLVRAADDHGPRVSVELPDGAVEVRCDPLRVVQVLGNLLGNALKYSPAGSHVRLRLTSDAAAGQAVVEVADTGRGIPADQLESVFEKFHRVEDPMLMTTGGTGLGLYIARSLTTAMGGTLACRSTLGQGSVFTLRLVLAVRDRDPGPVEMVPGYGHGATPEPR